MNDLLRSAIDALETASDPDKVGDAIRIIAEAAAVARHPNFASALFPELAHESIAPDALREARQSLLSWTEKNDSHPSVAAAFCSLGKFGDPTLREFLHASLARYVTQIVSSMAPVAQILAVLNTHGEGSISGNSFSMDEYGKNLDDAIRYLACPRT
jgi:hypothetical protein